MKKVRKVLALLLALVMCVGLVTVAASADGETLKNVTTGEEYEHLQDAIDAASSDDVIRLTGDHSETEYTIIENKEIVLDLNGFEFSFNSISFPYDDSLVKVNSGAQLTIRDTSAAKSGKIYISGVDPDAFTLEAGDGNIVIENGYFASTCCINATDATVKIIDGVFDCALLNNCGPGIVELYGGEFRGFLGNMSNGEFRIYGGEFFDSITSWGGNNNDEYVGYIISGGLFHKVFTVYGNAYFHVSGGTFAFDPHTLDQSTPNNEYPIVDGYTVVKNFIPIDGCDETWTVLKGIQDDPNGGQWADGSGDVKEYDLVDGEEFSHDGAEEPTREGYTFTGWEMSEDDGVYTFTAQWERITADTLTLTADRDTIYTNDDPSTAVLTLTYEPADAELGEIEWTQEGAGAVEFVTADANSAGSGSDADGAGAPITKTVKALSPGEVTITATDPASGKSTSVTMKVVTVMPNTEPEEPTEPTEPTDPTEPTEPAEPTEPTEPTETGDTEIGDGDTPLDGDVDIGDGDTPLDGAPKTGDNKLTALWIAGIVISGAVLALVLIPKKKEN